MPKGDPSKQTIRSQRYQEKVGYISKSYKLKKELVERFADACEKAGVGQAPALSLMMEEFIKKQEEKS